MPLSGSDESTRLATLRRGRGLEWLSELSDAEIARLLRGSSLHEHAGGETIFRPASRPASVYLLERGLVRIYRLSGTGAEVTLGYVPAGEVFGETGALIDQPRESFAQAIQPSRVHRIRRAEFRRVLDEHPRVGLWVTRQIGNRFKRMESRVESLVLDDVQARVARILCELAEDFGRPAAAGVVIDVPLSQQDLAMLVGATRQSVNLHLRALRDAGIIRYRDRRFALTNVVALRREAALDHPSSD